MTEIQYITDDDPKEIDFSNIDFSHTLGKYEFVNWEGRVINLQDQKLPKGVK
jgi:hypothetical protein